MKFIKEFFNRFGLRSPSFFQVLQKVGIVAGLPTGIPLLLTTFEADLHIVLPEWIKVFSQKAAVGGAVVLWIMAKLPVKDAPTIVKHTEKLPFTQVKEPPKVRVP